MRQGVFEYNSSKLLSQIEKTNLMRRAYYSNTVGKFLDDESERIFGILATQHQFSLEDLQKSAWIEQIEILKKNLLQSTDGSIFLEFAIPRMGKRVDAILVERGIIFVMEFKVGETNYSSYAIDQVVDYCLDLKNFHEQSHGKLIVPIIVATKAKPVSNTVMISRDKIVKPNFANQDNLIEVLANWKSMSHEKSFDPLAWENSVYKPTPTIIEAAQALYSGHSVTEISRSDASAINLSQTTKAILEIINIAKEEKNKAICFITGVPGAGKTLAGLNIANQHLNANGNEHAVFLSGNGPLVRVLQEALARNEIENQHGKASKLTKIVALTKAKTFIQNIHTFRDEALVSEKPPIEKIVIFDEAQRAWTKHQTSAFMKQKRGITDFKMSEPEFLIRYMDRHPDWAVIICLVGGGQEINTGEAGLPEWFTSLNAKFPDWHVYISDKLTDFEYTQGHQIEQLINPQRLTINQDLHLSVSLRSFRSEKVSALIKSLLDLHVDHAIELFQSIKHNYPIVITRDLNKAVNWIKERAQGTERYGIIASSGAKRLRPYGINIDTEIDTVKWFLNGKKDIRSSFFFEEVATEFDIQGLELDWTCVGWDGNLRFTEQGWNYMNFRGSNWQRMNDTTKQLYLKNTYRVLLTRARQGMVIFIPEGDAIDETRNPSFYDGTFNYLKAIGFEIL